ncbi:MAG: SUMF1/EgtB/PvdO family nonheme iron enzyme [Alistipes sp.]|nr:SUMF1/EgtB/PvdO family nonheme iron enzyme [Alistipes sp.]
MLLLCVAVAIGVTITIGLNRVYMYSSTDESCQSCHIHPQADKSWKQSVHHNSKSGVVTGCAECHLPPKGSVNHFMTKARMGLKDLWSYWTKDSASFDWESRKQLEYAVHIVSNESCKKCHQQLFPARLSQEGITAHLYYEENEKKLDLQCISCHLDVGHYDPNYQHKKMESIPQGGAPQGTVYTEPAQVTAFEDFTETIPGTAVSFAMKALPGGSFTLGSPADEPFRREDEGPSHTVSVSPFYMAEVETTWDQYWAFYAETMSEGRTPPSKVYANNSNPEVDAVSGPTPPFGIPDQGWGIGSRPAITMTHYAAEIFCLWLSKKTGKHYRLPTEAEWEYAARGGTSTPYFFEGDPRKLSDQGFWRKFFAADTAQINRYVVYVKNSKNKSQEPSVVKANPFGLKNMYGNVMEYCSDWYAPDAYAKLTDGVVDPKGPATGEEHVVRGGQYFDDAADLRSATRGHTEHDKWLKTDPQNPKSIWWYSDIRSIGFRVVCDPVTPSDASQPQE